MLKKHSKTQTQKDNVIGKVDVNKPVKDALWAQFILIYVIYQHIYASR